MSLINDALKRAKQAQDSADSPAPVPPLRPVEPAQASARHSLGVLLPIGLAVVALLGLMLFWVLWKKEGSTTTPPNAAPITVSARTPVPEVAPVGKDANTTGPATLVPASAISPVNEIAGNHSENSGSTMAAANRSPTNQVSNAAASAESNHVAAPEPTPAPLKLQSIVYSPKRPSALINGRVLFIGDRIRDFRVTAIHREAVVLTGGGHTNLLSLEP